MSEKSFNKTIIVSAVSLNYFEQCQKHQKKVNAPFAMHATSA